MHILDPYMSGSTEPWSASVIQTLIRLVRPSSILELGTFEGLTTQAICDAVPVDVMTVDIEQRWKTLPDNAIFVQQEATSFLRAMPKDSFDFVFVDDDHTREHVAEELRLLIDERRVRKGGFVVLHDVIGPFDLGELVTEREGWIVELPLLHAAGGLGVIQV